MKQKMAMMMRIMEHKMTMMMMTKVVESVEIGISFERERVEWSAWSDDDDDDDGHDDGGCDGDGDGDEPCEITNNIIGESDI